MTYNTEGKVCSVHPTIPRPCEICTTPSSVVPAHSPDNVVIDGVNWQAQAQTPYNTVQPNRPKHDPLLCLAAELGLDPHLDDPRDRVRPPVLWPVPFL